MKYYTILMRAWNDTLAKWSLEKEKADRGSEIGKYRAEKYWNELKELEILIAEEEKKEYK